MSEARRPRRPACRWLLAGIVVLLALAIRVPGLGDRTITHPEFYTSGLDIPDYVSHPHRRTTIPEVVTSVFATSDIHPPGIYFAMLGWTRVFGTSLLAIRSLPTLIGTLTILMVFLLGWRTGHPGSALGAGALLALHGMHIDKSVQSEIWIWPAFFAIAITSTAIEFERRPTRARWWIYVGLLAASLWSEYTLWIFAAAQIAIAAVRSGARKRAPSLLEAQAMAIVLALPVLFNLRYDLSHGARGYLAGDPFAFVTHILGFGSLVTGRLAEKLLGSGGGPLLVCLAVIGTVLLILGVRAPAAGPPQREPADLEPAGLGRWLLVAVLSSLGILGYAAALPLGWKAPALLTVAAWTVAVSYRGLIDLLWPFLATPLYGLQRRRWVSWLWGDAVVANALVPAAFLLVVGTFSNMLVPRVFLIATPFLLLVMSRGFVSLARIAPRPVPWIVGAVVLASALASTVDERRRERTHREYQAVARGLERRAAPGDLVVTRYDWYSAPLHYDLTPDRFEFLRQRDLPARLEPEVSRVWVILYGLPSDPRVQRELADYEKVLQGFVVEDAFEALGVQVKDFRRSVGLE